MAVDKGKNRYALLGNGEEATLPPLTLRRIENTRPIVNTDNWQEVKPRTKRLTTLVIRDENRPPVVIAPKTKVSPSFVSPTTDYEKPTEHWCGVCLVKFANKLALQNHVKQTPNHDNYCNLCTRVFKDRNGLKNHVDHALGHDVYCNLCLSAFKDKWGLRNHFENNYSVKHHHFVCLVCLEGFTRQDLLTLHLSTAPRHITCEVCHRNFRSQKERDEHWRSTPKHKHCLEPGCDFDGPNTAALEHHLDKDHFRCTSCRQIFMSNTRLTAHEQICLATTIHCPRCREIFPTESALTLHTPTCNKALTCSPYPLTTETSSSKYTSIPDSPRCWLCRAPFPTQTALLKHLETGKCPHFPDPSLLIKVMGHWWYSTLYMDVDLHASIRQGRTDVSEMTSWMKEGNLFPYVCRGEGCLRVFGEFRGLVHHLESNCRGKERGERERNGDGDGGGEGTCGWGVERLRLDWLEREVKDAMKSGGKA